MTFGTNVHDDEQKSLGFDHMLIVFGGLKGLEGALAADEQLNIDDARCFATKTKEKRNKAQRRGGVVR